MSSTSQNLTSDENFMSGLKARLFVFSQGFVYSTTKVSNCQTSRHAGVLVISADKTPIKIDIQQQNKKQISVSGKMLVLAPSVKRTIEAGSAGAVMVHFDPAHTAFLPMKKMMRSEGAMTVPARFEQIINKEVLQFRRKPDANTARRVFEKGSQVIAGICPANVQRDPRIVSLLNELQSRSPVDYDFENVLAPLNLSASRFSHLFTASAGLSLRSFIQWRKIRVALSMFESNGSMTEIAHASGFSDSAHFCRTFSKCLGMKPSLFGPDGPVRVKVVEAMPAKESAYV